jgi:hypothetical protein
MATPWVLPAPERMDENWGRSPRAVCYGEGSHLHLDPMILSRLTLNERFIEQQILEIHRQHPLNFYFFEIVSVRLRP